MVEHVDGVKVTELRYIKFDDYLQDVHRLSNYGSGLAALYVDDYVEFCEEHGEKTEPHFYTEIRKSYLTDTGRKVYAEVVELRAKLKEAKTDAEKQELTQQLYTLRGGRR